jgi:hypothetical protein
MGVVSSGRNRYHIHEPYPTGNLMNAPNRDNWSLLGSCLWLRPAEQRDVPRLHAFLERRDLARSRGANTAFLSRFLPEGEDLFAETTPSAMAMAVMDTMGAPAGFFAVHSGMGDGPAEVSFAVPADEKPVLREALRLLVDGLRAHTQLESVAMRVEPRVFDSIMVPMGWEQKEEGVWFFRLKRESVSKTTEARRAR